MPNLRYTLPLTFADVSRAGFIPLELVPRCTWSSDTREHVCRCCAPKDPAFVDSCSSEVALQLLIGQGLVWTKSGVIMWGVMAVISLAVWWGWMFAKPFTASPKLAKYAEVRRNRAEQLAVSATQAIASQVRRHAREGKRFLGIEVSSLLRRAMKTKNKKQKTKW